MRLGSLAEVTDHQAAILETAAPVGRQQGRHVKNQSLALSERDIGILADPGLASRRRRRGDVNRQRRGSAVPACGSRYAGNGAGV